MIISGNFKSFFPEDVGTFCYRVRARQHFGPQLRPMCVPGWRVMDVRRLLSAVALNPFAPWYGAVSISWFGTHIPDLDHAGTG